MTQHDDFDDYDRLQIARMLGEGCPNDQDESDWEVQVEKAKEQRVPKEGRVGMQPTSSTVTRK